MTSKAISYIKKTSRTQAVASALASVRAEGLEPSTSTVRRMRDYAAGKLTAQQLRDQTVADVQANLK